MAVESLDLPGVVDEREPFQFTASVRTDRTVETEAVLFRDGVEIARTRRTFQPGATQLTFRDVIDRPGVARYRLRARGGGRSRAREQPRRRRRARRGAGDDPARQRQRRPRQSQPRAVGRQAARDDDRRAPARCRTISPGCSPYRAVILENVPAGAGRTAGARRAGALRHRSRRRPARDRRRGVVRRRRLFQVGARSVSCRCRWRSRTSTASCRWRWRWRSIAPAAWPCRPPTAGRRWTWRISARARRSRRSGRSTRSA